MNENQIHYLANRHSRRDSSFWSSLTQLSLLKGTRLANVCKGGIDNFGSSFTHNNTGIS
jgi:hypothetical protein